MYILLILLFFIPSAFAQTLNDNPLDEGSSGVVEQRPLVKPDEFRVTMTHQDCARIVDHVARNDVAYKSGIDSRGNAVMPADLGGAQNSFDLPDDISFDLALNPFNYGGNADLATIFSNSSVNLGTIKYSILNAKLTLNGKALTPDQASIIAQSCRAQGIVK